MNKTIQAESGNGRAEVRTSGDVVIVDYFDSSGNLYNTTTSTSFQSAVTEATNWAGSVLKG